MVISVRLRLAGHVACMEMYRNAYRVLVGKPEGKRLLGTPTRRMEDNIRYLSQKIMKDRGLD